MAMDQAVKKAFIRYTKKKYPDESEKIIKRADELFRFLRPQAMIRAITGMSAMKAKPQGITKAGWCNDAELKLRPNTEPEERRKRGTAVKRPVERW